MRLLKFHIIFIILHFSFSAAFPQKDHRIRNVIFKGNEILDDDELLAQFNTRPKKSLQRLFFWKKNPELILQVLQEDTARLRTYYNRNGFLHPEINMDLDTTGLRNLVKVIVNIRENDFVIIRDVDLRLVGADSSGIRLLDSLRQKFKSENGTRFQDENIFKAQELLEKSFSDHGYPFIRVDYEIEVKDSKSSAGITFLIDPGERSYFGRTEVLGDTTVPEDFIRKYLLFSEGELYSQEEIDESQQDIFGTDLFQYVVVTSRKDSVENNRIPIKILLKELPVWNLETGFGYGTEDRLRLSAQLTKLGFLGGARRLIVNAKTSYYNPFGLDFRFIQPDIFAPNLDFVLNPFFSREKELSYTFDRFGGGTSFLFRLGRRISSSLTYSVERVLINEIDNLQLEEPQLKYTKSVINAGMEFFSADDRFYPSKGYRITGNIALSGIGFRTSLPYLKTELTLINYFRLDEDFVLATKLRSGVLQPTGAEGLTPLEEKYFLGGASSLRGWGRHDIYPANPANISTGGNTMIEVSAELRFPVYDIVHAALFTDAGNTWADSWYYDLSDLRYDIGTGLRVRSPIGPIRLDFATPVIRDNPAFQFFISVGHTF